MARALHLLAGLLALSLFALATWNLKSADWTGAIEAVAHLPPANLGIAGLLIVSSFLIFSLYDQLAWRWHGNTTISLGLVFRVSFVATCAAMNIGISALSGSAVRLTLYGRQGYSITTIGAVYFRTMILYAVGWFFWLGIALFASRELLYARFGVPPALGLLAGAVSLSGGATYLVLCHYHITIRFRRFKLSAPSLRLALAHLLVAAADILTSAGVFHVLVTQKSAPFSDAIAMFMLANTAGMVSQIPGGLGVFEWIALELASSPANAAQALAGLLVFRLAFFWIPLLAAFPVLLLSLHPRPNPSEPHL